MNLQHHYWYFKQVIPKRYCDAIINYASTKKHGIALIGNNKNSKNLNWNDKKNLFKHRKSNIVWLDEKWIYNLIIPFVKKANINANWNFDVNIAEQCQFTKYHEGQFYDWHCDSFAIPYGVDSERQVGQEFYGKIRKLSVTLSLSNPNDYRGGELEFCFTNNPKDRPITEECKQILPQGSLVVFPSFVYHRVKPVTWGNRYSLVIWNCGKPFV